MIGTGDNETGDSEAMIGRVQVVWDLDVEDGRRIEGTKRLRGRPNGVEKHCPCVDSG